MWSSSSSRPPGTRTRFISPIAVAGLGIVHSDSAQTTVSNDASPQGRCSASPSRRSTSRPRSAARWRAMASIAGLSSIPVTVAAAGGGGQVAAGADGALQAPALRALAEPFPAATEPDLLEEGDLLVVARRGLVPHP